MKEFKKALGQLLIGIFFTVLIFPILKNPITVMTSSSNSTIENAQKVGNTLWYHRLPEIYFHAVFLGSSIIACMLIIRKPPRMLSEGEK